MTLLTEAVIITRIISVTLQFVSIYHLYRQYGTNFSEDIYGIGNDHNSFMSVSSFDFILN